MMDEYISKEAVLELLCKECTENCTGGTPYRCYDPCAEFKLIQALTAADVKPAVKGEWITIPQEIEMTSWDKRCSVCNAKAQIEHNFCPNCGANMRKPEEKEHA